MLQQFLHRLKKYFVNFPKFSDKNFSFQISLGYYNCFYTSICRIIRTIFAPNFIPIAQIIKNWWPKNPSKWPTHQYRYLSHFLSQRGAVCGQAPHFQRVFKFWKKSFSKKIFPKKIIFQKLNFSKFLVVSRPWYSEHLCQKL